MSIDSTVGGTSSNSFVSLSEADTYFENSPKSSLWDAVVEQESALIYATTLLDSMVSWVGVRSTSTQALDWPRDVDDHPEYDDIIPVNVKRATFELALTVQDGTSTITDVSVDSVKVGPISVNLNEDMPTVLLPQLVIAMISELGSVASYSGSGVCTPGLLRV